MILPLKENRRHDLWLIMWWLAVLYAFFCVAHPFLIGCGCSDAGAEHTCGIVQYYASIGSAAWTVLLPLGMYLFRYRENMLIFLLVLAFIPLTCTLFHIAAPSLGFSAGDLLTTGMAEFIITLLFTLPLTPYIGFLPLMGTGADTETLCTSLFLYALATAVFGIYLYRRRNE
ncbi:MAG: hypothetical protein IKY52_04355 [Clostridia bacterium]|nr:hypothetical protein [Clostridia bacterium]